MGCDFYIYVYLEIEHSFGTAYCELPVRRGYFSDVGRGYYDSDEDEEPPLKEEYEKLYQEVIKLDLTPHPPIIIYEKDAFMSHHFEEKYKPLLEQQFKTNLLKNQKYENDTNYNSDDDTDSFYRRYEDEGISPDSFDQVIKITRKENRHCPSNFWDKTDEKKICKETKRSSKTKIKKGDQCKEG